jgi:hypothetical protein
VINLTKEEFAKSVGVLRLASRGFATLNTIERDLKEEEIQECIFGLVSSCEESRVWIKNTSFQWHKAQSVVVEGFRNSSLKTEIYLTDATARIKVLGQNGTLSISCNPQTARLFKTLPSILKVLDSP